MAHQKNTRSLAIYSTWYLPTTGGLQHYVYWFMKAIDDHYEAYCNAYGISSIHFLIPYQDGVEAYCDFKNITCELLQPHKTVSQALLTGKALAQYCKKHKISLIHGISAFMDGMVCFFSRLHGGPPYLLSGHGEDIAYDRELDFGVRLSFIKNILSQVVVRSAQALTTISIDMCRYAQELTEKNRIHLIPDICEYPIPKDRLEDLEAAKERLKYAWGISDNDTVYLTLSGLRLIKGHKQMLEAFAYAHIPSSKLIVGADSPYRKVLEKLCWDLKISDRVIFSGFLHGVEKRAAYDLSDVYVNTALLEPFGITYLEAIAHECAVLGSIRGGGLDIFQHNKSAILINPRRVDEIAQGLRELSCPKRRESLCHEAKKILPRYHHSKILPQFFSLYQKYGNFSELGLSHENTGVYVS